MKKELGIARCGLACCLCSENEQCKGCLANDCQDKDWCEVRKCTAERRITHCYECSEAQTCQKGLMSKPKPKAFTLFAKQYGEEYLLKCLETNEKDGVIYHRTGINGDYDQCETQDEIFALLKKGE